MPRNPIYVLPSQKLELDLTPVERQSILANIPALPSEYAVMLKKVHPEQPLLFTLDEMESLAGYVATEANETSDTKAQTKLQAAFEKIMDVFEHFTDEGLLMKKTTKQAVAKRKRRAPPQKKTADDALYIANWSAAMLHAAENRGIKNKRLEEYAPNPLDQLVLSTLPSVRPEIQERVAAGKDKFTVAEVGGMLMAISEALCEAPLKQQPAMFMVAHSLMTAMQEWVNEVKPNEADKKPAPSEGLRPRATKKTRPRQKPEK